MLLRVYVAALSYDDADKPTKMGTSKRSFCTNCSSMLWNYHDEYPDVGPASLALCYRQLAQGGRPADETQWIYPFASTIDAPSPLPPIPDGRQFVSIMRSSCPNHVPKAEGSKVYQMYAPGKGIEVCVISPFLCLEACAESACRPGTRHTARGSTEPV
jgi:hypothetical protein